ncbi:oligosaccharide repeat unit polymerase [Aeromonas salmonicida]|uniref:oligosaccharide repeat unit polymerase n=1 Tax=Aeromonas salmonicida TaxID=645 RepID=UPI003D001292
MFKTDFLFFYIENIQLALGCLFASLLITYLIIRKLIYSVFDPMFFFFLLSGSGYSVVLLLYFKDKISGFYFFSFLLTQFLFFLSWYLSASFINDRNDKSAIKIDSTSILFYYVSLVLFISCQLLVYKLIGIPLLMDSRLDAFSGGGGIGTLDRIIFVSGIVSYAFAFFRMSMKIKRNIIEKLVDLLVIVFMLLSKSLSGSKAGVLDLVFFAALTIIFLRSTVSDLSVEKRINKIFLLAILISLPMGMLTYIIQMSNSSEDAGDILSLLAKFMFRFVNTGDIYYLSWVNDYISRVSSENGMVALFSDFLGSTRLIDRTQLPEHLGFAVFLEHTTTPNTIGPNARFNVFSMHYFGLIGSILFAIICGMVCGFIRGRLRYIFPKSTSSLMLYVVLAYSATFIEQDPNSMFLKYVWNIILYYSTVYLLCYLLSAAAKPLNARRAF